ncbi:cell wall-binding repeat-containing protein [Miniphocaeibacter halophilus]|uniref:Cell wall-binding repeat-containing protein n=1 Tax=Miniphocaeibacter halophilus TaxID=2931922 RepID=A0AC61MPQ2_9FIRM|nr:cell wall-binding repeat-containing protein [Miniphocaeibacter halophilus]QQK07412.1 cell wall-binding repeat-containing protein [Miniphocaeibacter halophilus]
MKKRLFKIIISVVFILGMVFPKISLANERDLDISRISGADRYETAVEVSRKTFPKGSKYVIVASGEDFPDALVGGTLASQIDAPILLVTKNIVTSQTRNEIKRLKPSKIYILGGIETISKNVEDNLKILGTTERLAGKDRFETAHEISSACFRHSGSPTPGDTFAVINAYNFADSLSAPTFVGQSTKNHETHSVITGLFLYSEPTFPHIIFGGIDSIPRQASEEYEETGIRYAGSNRYGTAVEVAKAYKTYLNQDIDTIVLVDGTDYPDGLASASVASMNNGAILLTNPKNLSKETKEYIASNKNIRNIIIVGGENSVSENVEKELEDIVGKNIFAALDLATDNISITHRLSECIWEIRDKEEIKEISNILKSLNYRKLEGDNITKTILLDKIIINDKLTINIDLEKGFKIIGLNGDSKVQYELQEGSNDERLMEIIKKHICK